MNEDNSFSIKIKKGRNSVKCPVCKTMNDRSEATKVETNGNARYCCPGCVDEYIGNVEKTNTRLCAGCKHSFKLKDMKNASEVDEEGKKTGKKKLLCPECYSKHLLKNSEWARLIETVCKIYRCYDPTPAMLYQLKNLSDSYGFTYEEMRECLVYNYIICEKPVKQGESLGVIPFIYAEAKDFFKQKKLIDEKNRSFNQPVMANGRVAIKLVAHEPRVKKHKPIDIESISIVSKGEETA